MHIKEKTLINVGPDSYVNGIHCCSARHSLRPQTTLLHELHSWSLKIEAHLYIRLDMFTLDYPTMSPGRVSIFCQEQADWSV